MTFYLLATNRLLPAAAALPEEGQPKESHYKFSRKFQKPRWSSRDHLQPPKRQLSGMTIRVHALQPMK
jgi:hypothetical protein